MRGMIGHRFRGRKWPGDWGWRSGLFGMKKGNFRPESEETMAIKSSVLYRAKNTGLPIADLGFPERKNEGRGLCRRSVRSGGGTTRRVLLSIELVELTEISLRGELGNVGRIHG